MQQISPLQLSDWLADDKRRKPVLLDVREPWEYELCHVAGSKHVPMHSLPARMAELDPDQAVVVVCHHGVRSLQAGMFLEHSGFTAVFNLTGGVEGWAREVEPAMARY